MTRNYKTLRGKHRQDDEINQSKILYDPPLRVREIKLSKWDLIKLKSFGTAKSPSVVILEPRKIKSDTVSTVSPSISHEVVGLDAMIFVF